MKNQKKINRRSWLQLGLGATISTLTLKLTGCKEDKPNAIDTDLVETCTPTKYETMGPFHPNQPQGDSDFDLTQFNGGEAPDGEIIQIYGRVLDQDCKPVSGALVMIWHANTHGKYNHEYDNGQVEDDPNFQGWGQVKTDEKGNYSFKTIKAGAYEVLPGSGEMRTPHVHYKISKRGYHEMITQLYFDGEDLNDQDMFLPDLTAEEKAQVVKPIEKSTEGDNKVNFDIVLKKVKKAEQNLPEFADFVGTYELQQMPAFEALLNDFYNGTKGKILLTISLDQGLLHAEMPIQPKCEIYPTGKDQFEYRAFEADLTFKRNAENKVDRIALKYQFDFPDMEAVRVS